MNIKCVPCHVRFNGSVYHIHANGVVYATNPSHQDHGEPLPEILASIIRGEAARLRRNRNARERTQAMKDLGLKRGSGGAFGGWE